ncbi:MAG TPA: glycosyltransferase family 1 protein [Gammaproteobacteria bacterium]|nr:glycosyltransferase family 1 protein [Gammaproteobacteria bacterium]
MTKPEIFTAVPESYTKSAFVRRIAIITDAWHPQVNGVVNTLIHTGAELCKLGHRVLFVTPQSFHTVPCPTYPSIRLAILPAAGVARMLREFAPEAVHIATEGPLGHAARTFCLRQGWRFTTSFHTQFPEYIRARVPIPLQWSYAYLRRFHNAAAATMVATPSMLMRLHQRRFRRVALWSRGVDSDLFKPRPLPDIDGIGPRPLLLYVGRVAVEKNLEAFLRLDVVGTKIIVGDGPDIQRLRATYPSSSFLGEKRGQELAATMAAADVFVFPSRTDTFGLVMLEAMACGVPVAAYPVTGPIDVVRDGKTGVLDEDLATAIAGALKIPRQNCVEYARRHTWRACAERFVSLLVPVRSRKSVTSNVAHGCLAG